MYTWFTIPNWLMEQTIARRNHGINIQELLAIPLLLGTFGNMLRGCLVSYFGDADGVNGAFLAGASHDGAEDMNLIIGRCWLELAAMQVGFHVYRVESEANISDGPSRLNFEVVRKVGARYVRPCMPGWISDFWKFQEMGDFRPERL